MSMALFLKAHHQKVLKSEKVKDRVERGVYVVLSHLYKYLIRCRHFFYDRGFLKVQKAPLPVISIGNLLAGGTGKTPFTIFLAEKLLEKVRVAILSRGYGRKGRNVLKVSTSLSHHVCGDEPLMMAQLLPKANVFVAKERFKGALEAKKVSDIVLLDDGMQHRKLHRDLEVVLLRAKDLFGEEKYLPLGHLREDPKRLKGAHFVVIHGVTSKQQFDSLSKEVKHYTSAGVLGTRTILRPLVDAQGDSVKLEGKKVGLFCAIGDPGSFIETVKEAGADIVEVKQAIDHAVFDEESLKAFAKECEEKGCHYLVCTEKDWVKYENLALSLPLLRAQVELEVCFGKKVCDQLIEKAVSLTPIGV